MGPTHHLHPNVRFLQLRSSDEKSTVRSDRKSLIDKKKKVYLKVGLFLFASLRLARPARAVSSQGCTSFIYVYSSIETAWEA